MDRLNPLTRAELLQAAAQAERYPPGHGTDWGWGPLSDWWPDDEIPDAQLVAEYG